MGIKYARSKETGEWEVSHIDSPSRFVYVPDTIGGKPITGIRSTVLEETRGVETLSLPSSIRYIEEGAFENAFRLTVVHHRNDKANLNRLSVDPWNGPFLSAFHLLGLGDLAYRDKAMEFVFSNHEAILIESNDLFVYEPIHCLRFAVGEWLGERGIEPYAFDCGELDSDEESDPHLFDLPDAEIPCVILDRVDDPSLSSYVDQIAKMIGICKERGVPVIGLVSKKGRTNPDIRKLFHERIWLLNR